MRIWLAAVICLSMFTPTRVESTQVTHGPSLRTYPSYCGVYSVYGALRSVGIECDFGRLLRPDIVTSPFGSTLDDLDKAAKEHGAFSVALANMTVFDLQDAPCPVILHVADERGIGVYNHWILYLGAENGLARIVDAPHELEPIAFAELLARWDGLGLLVSEKPIDLTEFHLRRWLGALLLLSGGVGLAAVGYYRRSPAPRLTLPAQVAAIAIFSVGLAVAFHAFARDGMLRNSLAVKVVQQSHLPITLPDVSANTLAELRAKQNAVAVDARFEDAFQQGHIPGAINIPMTASRAERRALLAGVPMDRPIVVYCETDECAYSDYVGRALIVDGHRNVFLYAEGWRTWSSRMKEQ